MTDSTTYCSAMFDVDIYPMFVFMFMFINQLGGISMDFNNK